MFSKENYPEWKKTKTPPTNPPMTKTKKKPVQKTKSYPLWVIKINTQIALKTCFPSQALSEPSHGRFWRKRKPPNHRAEQPQAAAVTAKLPPNGKSQDKGTENSQAGGNQGSLGKSPI